MQEELYLCTPVKVDPSRNYYLISFEPNATMASAHHILLYGCGKPGSSKPVWDCGEMIHGINDNEVPCAENSQVCMCNEVM